MERTEPRHRPSEPADPHDTVLRRSSKLVVGSVDDPAEAEADAIARAAVTVLAAAPAAESGYERIRRHRPRVARSAVATAGPPTIGADGGAVDGDTEARIRRARGGGNPLEAGLADSMSRAIGHDVSRARIHTGAESRTLSDRIQAEAFTVGNDVHFRNGMPDTSTPAGQHLLAHELAHTVQQSSAARRTIRRVPAKVLVTTELRKAHPSEADKIDDSDTGVSRSAALPGDVLDVDPAVTRTDSSTPAVVYYQTTRVGSKKLKRFVRAQSVQVDGQYHRGKVEDPNAKLDTTMGKIGGIAGVAPEINDALEGFKSRGGNVESNMETGMGIAGGAGDSLSMITGLASSIAAFNARGANGSDKAGAVLSGVSSLGTGAKGISNIIDKSGAGGDAAKGIAQGIAGFADAFAGIKDTFFAIKHIVELVQEADKLNDKEKFAASMQIITEAMSAAKSGVSSAKSFMDLWGGGAGAPLVNAIPGFGIALSCVDIIIRAVDLVDSQIQRANMQTSKRKTKEELGGKKGSSIKSEAEAFIKKIDADRTAGTTISDQDEAKYEQYRDYLLSKGLQYISQKRTNRAILKICVAMGKIAGDAAVLGGASAPVGVGIKGGAMALDVGASAFRRFKQWGRDKAASTGATTGFFSIFNQSKSSDAKLNGYNKMVDKVFDMIIKASQLQGLAALAAEVRIGDFVGAMGMTLKQMYALKDDPITLRGAMVKAMQKRE